MRVPLPLSLPRALSLSWQRRQLTPPPPSLLWPAAVVGLAGRTRGQCACPPQFESCPVLLQLAVQGFWGGRGEQASVCQNKKHHHIYFSSSTTSLLHSQVSTPQNLSFNLYLKADSCVCLCGRACAARAAALSAQRARARVRRLPRRAPPPSLQALLFPSQPQLFCFSSFRRPSWRLPSFD